MLSNMVIFDQFAYTTAMEAFAYQVQLFNAATGGGLVLGSGANVGDFSDVTKWVRPDSIVRRRDAYDPDAVLPTGTVSQTVDTTVKVASGTKNMIFASEQFSWLQKSPEEAGVIWGRLVAEGMLEDQVNTAILAHLTCVSKEAGLIHDISGQNPGTMSYAALVAAAGKLGDRDSQIACWLMHSKNRTDLRGLAVANTSVLFNYGNVAVEVDPILGKRYVITDCPALTSGGKYYVCGLNAGAVTVQSNGDFKQSVVTTNGYSTIRDSYQAQWTFNLGCKGFAYVKGAGKSPDDAAIGSANSWTKTVTSIKDLGGVIIKTN